MQLLKVVYTISGGSTCTWVVVLEDKHIVDLATDNQQGMAEAALGQLGVVEV